MLYINLLCHTSSLVGESGCHLVEPRARLAARRLGPPLVKSIIHDARPVVLSIISGHFRCWFVPDLFFKVGKNLGIDSLGACRGDYYYYYYYYYFPLPLHFPVPLTFTFPFTRTIWKLAT